jgi:S1-C subfamily serine protease
MSKPTNSFTQMQDLSAALVSLVANGSSSMVAILSGRSRSSGFVWRPGLIVTADEALTEDEEFAVKLPGGDAVPAQLAGRDPTTDVALLRVDSSGLQPVSLVETPVATGALAVALGACDGTSTAALGIVSRAGGPWRSMRGGEIDARIELDLRLRQSAEGGLVLNAAGQGIGMAVFGPRRRVLVIPSATIKRVAATLESHGRIARGYLGLGLQPVVIEGGDESGAMVMSVDPQGPGAAASVHQGDILVASNSEPIRHVHSLLRALGSESVGQTVTLQLRRAGETQKVSITIAERPVA